MEYEFGVLRGTARIWGTHIATVMLYLGVTDLRLPEGELVNLFISELFI